MSSHGDDLCSCVASIECHDLYNVETGRQPLRLREACIDRWARSRWDGSYPEYLICHEVTVLVPKIKVES